jgi:hypothetical protein
LGLLLVVGLLGYVMWLIGDGYLAAYVLAGVLVLLAKVAGFLALAWVLTIVLGRVLPEGWTSPFRERRRQVVLVAATSLYFLYCTVALVNRALLPGRYHPLSLLGNAALLTGAFLLARSLLKLRPDRLLPYAGVALLTALLTAGLRSVTSESSAVATDKHRTNEITQTLATLPYIAFVPESEKHVSAGVGYADTVRSFPGFNLCSSLVAPRAFLLDMKGNVVHEWNKDLDPGYPWEFVRLCRNGDLLVSIQDRKLARLDWDSRIKWMKKLRCHHDVSEAPNGDIMVLQRSYGFTTVHDLPTPARDDHVVVLSAAGEVKGDFSVGQLLRDAIPVSRALHIWRWQLTNVRTSIQLRIRNAFMFDKGFMDLLHTNTVTVVDRDYNDILREGNLIVCSPMIDLVAVIDPKQSRVVWQWGPGELEGPHNSRVIDNGHILIFDNGVRRRYSRVVELDPTTNKIVWSYEDEQQDRFYSPVCGGAQRLPNGNTMITDTVGGRVFEVTSDGELVWEFYTPLPGDENLSASRPTIYRMERVTDFNGLPQLKGNAPLPSTQPNVDGRRKTG